MNNAESNTKLQSFMTKADGFNVKNDNSLDPNIVIGTSGAHFEMQWSRCGACRLGRT